MIIRERILERIRPFYDSDLIKVLIGLRRSGKSVILQQIREELLQKGVKEDRIPVSYTHLEMRAKYTGIALDKAQRLETLINEFFEIARFNLTTMQLEVTRIDLTMLLEQLASEFLPILKEKNLTLKSAIEPVSYTHLDVYKRQIWYCMGKVMPEPAYNIPLEGEAETAVYVLARNSGEGADRTPVAGDINLTETEQRDILALNEKYDKFILVLNCLLYTSRCV